MSMGRFLNPRNDVAFKRIFGSERNKDILIQFLNDILGPTRHKVIKEVTLIQTDQLPEVDALRESAVDVMCTDDQGHRFIVEMQIAREAGFEKRVQYYAAKAYIDQRGEDTLYKDLKEVIFVAILDHILFPQKTDYSSHHRMLDIHTYEHDLKDFSFFFLELGKFTKNLHDLTTPLERWSYFLRHGESLSPEEMQEIAKNAPIMSRAVHEMNRVNWTVEQLRAYDSADKRIFSHHGTLIAAREEGIEVGKAEGIEIGVGKGALEKAHEIARSMVSHNLDIALISQTTGLSRLEIENLTKN